MTKFFTTLLKSTAILSYVKLYLSLIRSVFHSQFRYMRQVRAESEMFLGHLFSLSEWYLIISRTGRAVITFLT